MTGVLLCLKRSILTKICAKSESVVTGMSQYEEEKKKAYEQYEKHKCRTCIWSRWQVPFVVTCLFPRCVKEETDE